jgi:formaldehyde-activating enzyme involved in methanogenesis
MSEPSVPEARRPEAAAVAGMARKLVNPFLLKLYFLGKLPLALMAGLRVRSLDAERCEVTVPYGWRTTNPFRSTYFAALAMAAELSTGALAILAVRLAPRPVAMLVVGTKATFEKKATGKTTFTCERGPALFDAVAQTVASGEPVTATVETVGRAADGVVVARFEFTWSFKARARRD